MGLGQNLLDTPTLRSGAYVGRLGGTTATTAPLPFINVKDYGAKGDGTTDDTAAIQAAFNAVWTASSATSGGTVYFPSGTYVISGVVYINYYTSTVNRLNGGGVTILGAGAPTSGGDVSGTGTTIKATGSPVLGFGTIAAFAATGNNYGITIRGVFFQGVGSNPQVPASQIQTYHGGTTGLFLNFNNAFLVDSCAFEGFSVGASVYNGNGVFLNCRFDGNQNAGLVCVNTATVKVLGGTFGRNGGNAATGYLCSNIYISGQALPPTATAGVGSNFVLDGGLVDEVTTNGNQNAITVYLGGTLGSVIRDTQIYVPTGSSGTSYGVYVDAGSYFTKLENVNVRPFTYDPTRVPTNTVYIAAGAVGTVLSDVVTSTNGGGDISDNGTYTYMRRVNGTKGVQTPPAVPASATTLVNPFPFDTTVYVSGGTVTAIKAGGIQVPSGVTLTTATTGGTLAPATYAYRIAARNVLGSTLASTEVTIVVPAGTSTNTVTVNWNPVPGATSYDVYGRSSGSELKMATLASTVWTDNGSVTPSGALPDSDATLVTTGLTSGMVRVAGGQTIQLTYTVAPTWQWVGD